jgi:hypothetical protein
MSSFDYEAGLFCQYIVKQPAPESVIKLYSKAVINQGLSPSSPTVFALKHPWSIKYLDAYSAFFKPNSDLHHRLFIMFAVLECTPKFYDDFMPLKRSRLYIFTVIKSGLASVTKLLVGSLLIRVIHQ